MTEALGTVPANALGTANLHPLDVLLKFGRAAGVLLVLAYVGVIASYDGLPYQDFPNHLARAVAMADLIYHGGAQFGQFFDFHFAPIPYVLGDVLLATLVELLGSAIAGKVWMTLVLLSLPAALLCYLRVKKVSADRCLLVLLVSLYLATDWFFVLGFTQFRLGVALLLLILSGAELLRSRWTAVRYLLFTLLIVAGYLLHLTVVVFLAPALAVSSAVRLYLGSTTFRREAAILGPLVAVLGWHFLIASQLFPAPAVAAYSYNWAGIGWKWGRIDLVLMRIEDNAARGILLLFIACITLGIWRDLKLRTLLHPAVLEMMALALTFLGIYVVLPIEYSDASYVDVRALSPMVLFLVLARTHLKDDTSQSSRNCIAFAVPIAALLGACNLAWITNYLGQQNAWASEYRSLMTSIPRGARVLPVYSAADEQLNPRLHMASYVFTDRAAMTPYLFSRNAGSPMKYFSYNKARYAPPEFWYSQAGPSQVSWHAIACEYDYVLVSKPFDERKIALHGKTTVAENSSSALLSVSPPADGCSGYPSPPGSPEDSGPKERFVPARDSLQVFDAS